MKKTMILFTILIIFFGCEKNEKPVQAKVKTKEERMLEKKEKYKSMLSENRKSGDIAGIWKIKDDNINRLNEFLNLDLKSLTGYCIEVSSDLRTAKLYFSSINKIFVVSIKQLSDTKYEMRLNDKKRIFEVVNLSHSLDKNSKDLIWFFEDSHKFNPKEGSEQLQDGFNFYDYCTSGINDYDCTVEGCLQDIKERDEYNKAESDAGPLGIEDEVDSNVKN